MKKKTELEQAQEMLANASPGLVEEVNKLVMSGNSDYENRLINLESISRDWKYDPLDHIDKNDQVMKDLIVSAYNANSKKKITANNIAFRGDGAVYLEEGFMASKPMNKIIEEQLVLSNLKAMLPIYDSLKVVNRALEDEMTKYVTEVLDIIKTEAPEKQAEEIMYFTQDLAKKFSGLPEKEIIAKSKELAKTIVATQGKQEDTLYSLKESCKWMLNKLTFGLTEQSAAQKIDTVFKGVAKNIIEEQKSRASSMKDMENVKALLDDDVFGITNSAVVIKDHKMEAALKGVTSKQLKGFKAIIDERGDITVKKKRSHSEEIRKEREMLPIRRKSL